MSARLKPSLTYCLLAAVCSLSLLGACDDDDGVKGGVDAGDAGGDAAGPKPDGSTGTGGTTGAGGSTGTGGTTTPGPDGGTDAVDMVVDGLPDSGGGNLDAGVGLTITQMVTAETGGTISLGGAKLLIPAGALEADTAITLSITAPGNDPWTANIQGAIYVLEPADLNLVVPAALTLPLGTVPANRDATIAGLDDASAQWFPVASTIEGNTITGSVVHFRGYAVLLLPKTEFCPFSGACGGAIDGTWEYNATCNKPLDPQPFACGTATPIQILSSYGTTGTITIAQGQYTSTQSIINRSTVYFTPSCLTAINTPTVVWEDCGALQEGLRTQKMADWICAGTLELGCSCVLENTLDVPSMGTAVVEGQKVTFNPTGGAPGQPADFCVKGEALILRDATGAVYTAIKK